MLLDGIEVPRGERSVRLRRARGGRPVCVLVWGYPTWRAAAWQPAMGAFLRRVLRTHSRKAPMAGGITFCGAERHTRGDIRSPGPRTDNEKRFPHLIGLPWARWTDSAAPWGFITINCSPAAARIHRAAILAGVPGQWRWACQSQARSRSHRPGRDVGSRHRVPNRWHR